MPLPKFRLSLLGRFELIGPDGLVAVPNKKLAGLLAYLACTAPVPQPRERLATLLWGSHFDTQARQNLRQGVFRLRQMLGQDAIVADGEDISLAPGLLHCDVGQLEASIREGSRDSITSAVDLFKGRLLADVSISEEAWTEWVAGERKRVEGLALDALVRFGEIELALGHGDKALEAAHRALAVNDLREDVHRLIIRTLAAAGRRAEAVKHYQDLVTQLKRELNTEPDTATRSMLAALRSSPPPAGTSPAAKEFAEPVPPSPERPSIAMPSPAGKVVAAGHEAGSDGAAARDEAVSPLAPRTGSADRRQLTIMVCNIGGSTSGAAHPDPEDMREWMAPFHKAVADVAARFDGFVAQYLGDIVHIYFGYPAARELDVEQAVRAGLAIVEAVGALKAAPQVTLQTSVGIATGLVVIGEQPGDTRQRVAIGETPIMAAQLQAAAAPGEVVIAATTRRLVGRLFDCHALPAIEMKGRPQSIEAWQVRGEAAGVSRFAARREGALPAFVGRQEEMELLLRRWEQAKAGEGRIVLLSGEPGIGKSRIAESLLLRLEGEPHGRLRYFCSPHHTHSALHPFIEQLERAANFEPGSSAAANLDKLEALLAPAAKTVPGDLALIADLLSVPTDGRYPVLAVNPQQKREMTLAALLDLFDGLAAQNPILVVFEDVHWIDPTSLELLDLAIARMANLPALLVITFRPEFQPAWVGQPQVTMLPLSRLGRRDSASIIDGIARGKTLPDIVVEQILAHTDGVPLFIEELTSMLLESRLLRETDDCYVLDEPLPAVAVPATLQASLVARLDRLASVKDVAQIGAAIGREFSHELIGAVAPLTPNDLDAALVRLTVAGLITRRGRPPTASYSFKHALVRDAAYGTMLKSQRRQLHASIATVLIERFPTLAEILPEVVARHFTDAGLASEAIGYWLKAGRHAGARSAHREAVEFLGQALRLLAQLPETRETLQLAIDVRFELKNSLFPLGEFDRVVTSLREAEGLARVLGDQRRLGEMSVHLCQTLWITGHPQQALASGQSARTIAESLGDLPLQVMGNLYLGVACLDTGDYRQAEDLLLNVLRLLDGDLSRNRFGLPGFPAVMARGYLTLMCALQGRFTEGIAHGLEGIRLAEALDHPYSLANTCWHLGHLHLVRGELSDASALFERGLALSREWNLTFFSVAYTGILGWADALAGRSAEAIPALEHTLTTLETMRSRSFLPLYLAYLGEAYVVADRLDDAFQCVGRALTLTREGGQSGYEALALRLLAEVTARRDPPEDADGRYRDALTLARGLGMRPLVARCHLGLGQLCARTGKRKQAREHQIAATEMYREMDMT